MKVIVCLLCFLVHVIQGYSQPKENALKISPLQDDFYIFTTYNYYKGSKIPANGMYLVTEKGVVLFDSPWDTTQFQPLLDSIQQRHHKKVIMCIASHFHEDRTGGLQYYGDLGIRTYTTKKTDELSSKRGMKRAKYLIEKDTTFTIEDYRFQVIYPGHGHAPDNIIFWFEKERILYGGCLIKSTEDESLGNLADADVSVYAVTLKYVQQKCNDPKYIIPGHNSWLDSRSLQHTLEMAEQIKPKN